MLDWSYDTHLCCLKCTNYHLHNFKAQLGSVVSDISERQRFPQFTPFQTQQKGCKNHLLRLTLLFCPLRVVCETCVWGKQTYSLYLVFLPGVQSSVFLSSPLLTNRTQRHQLANRCSRTFHHECPMPFLTLPRERNHYPDAKKRKIFNWLVFVSLILPFCFSLLHIPFIVLYHFLLFLNCSYSKLHSKKAHQSLYCRKYRIVIPNRRPLGPQSQPGCRFASSLRACLLQADLLGLYHRLFTCSHLQGFFGTALARPRKLAVLAAASCSAGVSRLRPGPLMLEVPARSGGWLAILPQESIGVLDLKMMKKRDSVFVPNIWLKSHVTGCTYKLQTWNIQVSEVDSARPYTLSSTLPNPPAPPAYIPVFFFFFLAKTMYHLPTASVSGLGVHTGARLLLKRSGSCNAGHRCRSWKAPGKYLVSIVFCQFDPFFTPENHDSMSTLSARIVNSFCQLCDFPIISFPTPPSSTVFQRTLNKNGNVSGCVYPQPSSPICRGSPWDYIFFPDAHKTSPTFIPSTRNLSLKNHISHRTLCQSLIDNNNCPSRYFQTNYSHPLIFFL
ncbi:hypothetical protein VP01_842g1 [Puccinia sorghi]|uniref:Uncharacterized protein n=1 Tax=Puccinia sorghi TaxID=27349 RepID=A0A0L6UA17_9BASI|nr:hypothetical protein VP01_842g1 [Puccinia sorghi]